MGHSGQADRVNETRCALNVSPFVPLRVPATQKELFVIVGPTAVGKTALAIQLAQQLDTEIISADSRQIYKEMELGTAKPSPAELAAVPHHFINSHSIHQEYNAGQYEREASELINRLFEKYHTLVMVGGSGLYIKAALEGFDDVPEVPVGIRVKIESEYAEKGLAWLQGELAQVDPDLYAKIDQKNPHRLIRALEVRLYTGQSIESFRAKKKKTQSFTVRKIGLELAREVLYERINQRMDVMIDRGLFEEAEQLYPFKHLNALQTVGYQEIFDFMDGRYSHEEAIRLLKQNSRHYAKRQLTWFKRDQEILWIDANSSLSEQIKRLGYK